MLLGTFVVALAGAFVCFEEADFRLTPLVSGLLSAAQRAFCAAAIRALPAALIMRFGFVVTGTGALLRGLPGSRAADDPRSMDRMFVRWAIS